jgi:hypothetical protein
MLLQQSGSSCIAAGKARQGKGAEQQRQQSMSAMAPKGDVAPPTCSRTSTEHDSSSDDGSAPSCTVSYVHVTDSTRHVTCIYVATMCKHMQQLQHGLPSAGAAMQACRIPTSTCIATGSATPRNPVPGKNVCQEFSNLFYHIPLPS